jgi:hypothetical protein
MVLYWSTSPSGLETRSFVAHAMIVPLERVASAPFLNESERKSMSFWHELFPLLIPFVPLLTGLLWPVTTLIILFWFRKGIKGLVQSLAEASIGNSLVFKFWQVKNDIKGAEPLPGTTGTAKQIIAPSDAKWQNVANLFWLGSDLDWTVQTMLRGAPKERIVHGLRQANHHSSQVGLANTAPGQQLALLKSQVEGMAESAMDRQWRVNFVELLNGVIAGFSDLVRAQQRDFRPSP